MEILRVSTAQDAADALADAAQHGRPLRLRAGGTKSSWGNPVEDVWGVLDLSGLNGVIEHNEGDLTAIVRAGTRLVEAQEVFARAGQMLALDPYPGEGAAATIGGIVATGDSGPLRHRFAAARDLVLGIRFATTDGKVARSGSKVIKNVAGYDLGKLFTGSFGTLGAITEVILRLHPLPRARVTALGRDSDVGRIEAGARALLAKPLELEALDVAWRDGVGEVLARIAGAESEERTRRTVAALEEAGLDTVVAEGDDEAALWERQRASQRSDDGIVIRVSARPAEIGRVLAAARSARAAAVGRVAFGLVWLALPAMDTADAVAAIDHVRARLRPYACVVLDAPESVRAKVDVWHSEHAGAPALMRRVKERFDPRRVCNPGIFVGGI